MERHEAFVAKATGHQPEVPIPRIRREECLLFYSARQIFGSRTSTDLRLLSALDFGGLNRSKMA
jgi:hypothetical protein